MDQFINDLVNDFSTHGDLHRAERQSDYMKGHFKFYGIPSPLRKQLQRPYLLRANLPPREQMTTVVRSLWKKPERELQYFAQEMVYKYSSKFEKRDISLFEHMITHKSWWDTVDFIASNILGSYFKKHPGSKKEKIDEWISSDNIWLQRSALLFQLKYKDDVDTEILEHVIHSLLGSKEFFINKAIGWSLRQYAKFNPGWVIEFVDRTPLENLSRREALKLIG